ncbi:hypothetical protein V8C37DRAFT_381193 [Trichoderma ceciliae]
MMLVLPLFGMYLVLSHLIAARITFSTVPPIPYRYLYVSSLHVVLPSWLFLVRLKSSY